MVIVEKSLKTFEKLYEKRKKEEMRENILTN